MAIRKDAAPQYALHFLVRSARQARFWIGGEIPAHIRTAWRVALDAATCEVARVVGTVRPVCGMAADATGAHDNLAAVFGHRTLNGIRDVVHGRSGVLHRLRE